MQDFFEMTQKDRVFLVGTALSAKDLPKSLFGLNRFETKVQLCAPSAQERLQILQSIIQRHGLRVKMDCERANLGLSGFVAGDIKSLLF